MAKTYRIMGMPFSQDRASMERFSREIEEEQAEVSENVPKHSLISCAGRDDRRLLEPGVHPADAPPKTRACSNPCIPRSAELAAGSSRA